MTTTPNQRAYAAMLAESKRLALPVAFKRDLVVHDRRWVARLPSDAQFVWVLRETGTHAYALGCRDQQRHGPADFLRTIAECWPESVFYIWDGVALISHGPRLAEVCSVIREMEAAMVADRRVAS